MYLPKLVPFSGTPVGNSYLTLFVRCPRKWYYQYLFPWDDGSEGLAPMEVRRPLLQGSMFHMGMAEWLRSGVKGGEDTGAYDLEVALAAMDHEAAQRKDSWPDETVAGTDLGDAKHLMGKYHEFFGPQGYAPDYPEMKVMCDDQGLPVIEQGYAIPLGYRDYIYTCQIDAIVLYRGMVTVLEHKTSHAGWVEERIATAHTDSQFDGELFVLRHAYPEHATMGARINVCIKGWEYGKRNKYQQPAQREFVNRTDQQLERFRNRAVSILVQIDDKVGEWRRLRAAGLLDPARLEQLFPSHGLHNGSCFMYRSDCEFKVPCKMGDTAGSLRGYRARTPAERTATQADPGA